MATPTFLKINFSQIKSESRRSSGGAREKCGSTPCPQVHELEVSPDKAPGVGGAELSRTFEQIIPFIIEEPDKEEDDMAANLHTGFHEGQQKRMFETIEVEFSTKSKI